MRAPLALAATLIAMLALAGCNTVSGAGKDVSSTGKAITKTAEDVKN
jgi:entericidin B